MSFSLKLFTFAHTFTWPIHSLGSNLCSDITFRKRLPWPCYFHISKEVSPINSYYISLKVFTTFISFVCLVCDKIKINQFISLCLQNAFSNCLLTSISVVKLLSSHQHQYSRLLQYLSSWRTHFNICPHTFNFFLIVIMTFFKKLKSDSLDACGNFCNGFPKCRKRSKLLFIVCKACPLLCPHHRPPLLTLPSHTRLALLPVPLKAFTCCLCLNICPSDLYMRGIPSPFKSYLQC